MRATEQQKNYALRELCSANSHKTEVCLPCAHSPRHSLIPDYPSQSAAAGTKAAWQHPGGASQHVRAAVHPFTQAKAQLGLQNPCVTSEQHRSAPGRAAPDPQSLPTPALLHNPTKPKPFSAKGFFLPPQNGKGTIDSSLQTWQAMWELIQPGWASWSQENNFGSLNQKPEKLEVALHLFKLPSETMLHMWE